MYEGLTVTVAALLIFLLGIPLAHLVDARRSSALALPFGMAHVAIVTTALYVAGVNMHAIRWVLIALSFSGMVVIALNHKAIFSERSSIVLTAFLAVFALLCAPILARGTQLAAFQGNIWDHFNYLTGSVVYAKHNITDVLSTTSGQVLSDPLLYNARVHLAARPTVFFLFGLLLTTGKLSLPIISYLFLALVLAISFPAIFYFIDELTAISGTGPDSRAIPFMLLAAAAFPLGFWGQYVLDIDAWSQLASISLLVTYVAFSVKCVLHAERVHTLPDWRLVLGLAVTLWGGVLIYPESTLVHVFVVGLGLTMLLLKRALTVRTYLSLAVIMLIGLLGGFTYYDGVIGHSLRQTSAGMSASKDWWVYFQRFLLGRDNFLDMIIDAVGRQLDVHAEAGRAAAATFAKRHLLAHWTDASMLMRIIAVPINLLLSIIGLYFLTPTRGLPTFLYLLWLAFDIFVAIALYQSMRTTWHQIEQLGRNARVYCSTVLFGLFLMVALLLLRRQIWSAGKALAFASPFIVMSIALPAVSRPKYLTNWKALRGLKFAGSEFVLAYVGFSVILAITRVALAAAHPSGIVYDPPYPGILHPEAKTEVDWTLSTSELGSCRSLDIRIPEKFARHYVALSAELADIPYSYTFPLNTSYAMPVDYPGNMRQLHADCRIDQIARSGRLHFKVSHEANVGL